MRAGGKHPPQTYTLSKSPVLIGLRQLKFWYECGIKQSDFNWFVGPSDT